MEKFIFDNMWVLVLVLLWTLPWKGVALWKSARKGHLGWFTALIVLNTLGILEILYIFIFSKIGQKKVERNDRPRQMPYPNERPTRIVR